MIDPLLGYIKGAILLQLSVVSAAAVGLEAEKPLIFFKDFLGSSQRRLGRELLLLVPVSE